MTVRNAPSFVNRIRSRQAGHPTGLLGRIIGRVMVKDTASANDRAVDLLQLTAPSAVLEIGFGQGSTVARLVDAGHKVLGVDVSNAMVAQAGARNRRACADGRAQLVRTDGIGLPIPDYAADAALTVHTIYFMPDPSATFAEVARVLRPGGMFAIACRVGLRSCITRGARPPTTRTGSPPSPVPDRRRLLAFWRQELGSRPGPSDDAIVENWGVARCPSAVIP